MTTDKTIIDEKLQYGINIGAGKKWVLLSGNIDKCEYPIGDEILLFNQNQMIEQTKFTYSPLGEAFETKPIEDQEQKINKSFRIFILFFLIIFKFNLIFKRI